MSKVVRSSTVFLVGTWSSSGSSSTIEYLAEMGFAVNEITNYSA